VPPLVNGHESLMHYNRANIAPMNWLLKKLGYRDRKYRAADFSVTIEPGFREIVSVMHERGGTRIHLDGERIGKKWEGIAAHIP
jgi:hypothetical protein